MKSLGMPLWCPAPDQPADHADRGLGTGSEPKRWAGAELKVIHNAPVERHHAAGCADHTLKASPHYDWQILGLKPEAPVPRGKDLHSRTDTKNESDYTRFGRFRASSRNTQTPDKKWMHHSGFLNGPLVREIDEKIIERHVGMEGRGGNRRRHQRIQLEPKVGILPHPSECNRVAVLAKRPIVLLPAETDPSGDAKTQPVPQMRVEIWHSLLFEPPDAPQHAASYGSDFKSLSLSPYRRRQQDSQNAQLEPPRGATQFGPLHNSTLDCSPDASRERTPQKNRKPSAAPSPSQRRTKMKVGPKEEKGGKKHGFDYPIGVAPISAFLVIDRSRIPVGSR